MKIILICSLLFFQTSNLLAQCSLDSVLSIYFFNLIDSTEKRNFKTIVIEKDSFIFNRESNYGIDKIKKVKSFDGDILLSNQKYCLVINWEPILKQETNDSTIYSFKISVLLNRKKGKDSFSYKDYDFRLINYKEKFFLKQGDILLYKCECGSSGWWW